MKDKMTDKEQEKPLTPEARRNLKDDLPPADSGTSTVKKTIPRSGEKMKR